MHKAFLKKGCVVVASAVLAMTGSVNVFSVSGETENGNKGDLNGNGTIQVADAVLLQGYLLGANSLSYEAYANADMNGDARVNGIDLALLRQTLLSGATTPTEPTPTEPTPTDPIPTEPVPTEPDPDTPAASAYAICYANGAVTITDENGSIVTECDCITVNGQIVTITKPGEYEVTGVSDSGQLIVDVDKTAYPDGAVTLSLSGLTLSNASDSPVYVANIGDECVITAKVDTVNTISDGTSYTNADGKAGAIYACDDLKIKGKGTLNVSGNCEDGIVCKNDLRIFNGTVNVTAVDEAIRGKDSVRIGDPDKLPENGGSGDYSNLNITAISESGDAIKSDETDSAEDGFIVFNGGTVNVTAKTCDGIQAERDLTINGGEITVDAQGSAAVDSAKGIKADNSITINGGTIHITTAADDAVKTAETYLNGAFTMNGGELEVNSGSSGKGIQAYGTILIKDGVIDVTAGNEGIESKTLIQIDGGEIHVSAGDDGFNVGGEDSADKILIMNGGFVYAEARADVMDSNGLIAFNGGTAVLVRLSITGNTTIDASDGMTSTISFNGGKVLAVGSSKDLWSQDVAGYVGDYADKVIYNSNVGSLADIAAVDASGNVLSYLNATFNSFNSYGILYAPGTEDVTLYNNASVTGGNLIYGSYYEGGIFVSGTAING
ncbi:MAG: carbohydrate-binding domain-containing protein [Ruminococcus sp.]